MSFLSHILTISCPLLLLMTAGGCRHINTVDYSRFVYFGKNGIPQGWEYEFAPVESDSANIMEGVHDAVIVVRYTNTCTSRSVILDIEQLSLADDTPDSLRIKIPLFNDEGQPLGRGNYGVYEVTDTLRKSMKVPEGLLISVSSPLPEEQTRGVNAIGLVLSRPYVDTTLLQRIF